MMWFGIAQKGDFGKKVGDFRHTVLGRVGGTIGTL